MAVPPRYRSVSPQCRPRAASTRTRPPNSASRTATLSCGAWSAKSARRPAKAPGNAHPVARPEPRLLGELDQSVPLAPLELRDDGVADTGGAVTVRTRRMTPGLNWLSTNAR